MQILAFSVERVLQPLFWVFLTLAGVLGLVALCSPRLFADVSARSSRWVDTSRLLSILDKRIDIDEKVLPFSRALGAAVVVAVAVLATVLFRR